VGETVLMLKRKDHGQFYQRQASTSAEIQPADNGPGLHTAGVGCQKAINQVRLCRVAKTRSNAAPKSLEIKTAPPDNVVQWACKG
jgi:hypothetical protein